MLFGWVPVPVVTFRSRYLVGDSCQLANNVFEDDSVERPVCLAVKFWIFVVAFGVWKFGHSTRKIRTCMSGIISIQFKMSLDFWLSTRMVIYSVHET
jgi:hypothetical protein